MSVIAFHKSRRVELRKKMMNLTQSFSVSRQHEAEITDILQSTDLLRVPKNIVLGACEETFMLPQCHNMNFFSLLCFYSQSYIKTSTKMGKTSA